MFSLRTAIPVFRTPRTPSTPPRSSWRLGAHGVTARAVSPLALLSAFVLVVSGLGVAQLSPQALTPVHADAWTQDSAGADTVGAEEIIAKISGENWTDFDVCITTPDMMGQVGRVAKILGPKGLMPNPKSGTVTMDVAKAVKDTKAGKVEYRLDKTAIIHCAIGKKSFGPEKLAENFRTIMEAVIKAKPAAAKGIYLKSVVGASTMGPGVKLKV